MRCRGLGVEPNPLDAEDEKTLDIGEDEYLAVVCKPAGMLSVPGKANGNQSTASCANGVPMPTAR